MRSKNRNFKLVAVGALLYVTTCTISPTPTYATNGWDIDLKNYADTLGESSISISIGGANNEILNADKGVAQGIIKQIANVEFGATNGYTVKISGTPNLTGASTKATIPSAALTLGNMVNQWGWYAENGAADCSESSVYKTMTTEGTQIDSGVLADGGTKTYTMCFGMRVNGNQAADTYNGSVTVSAVAEPGMIRTAPFSGITYMQDMTANICKLADENETAQLIDRRDNKKYWVTKLLDGNCWMSQNLALNIEGSIVASNNDGSTFTWNNGHMATSIPQSGLDDATSTYAWDLGNYVIKTPETVSAACSNQTGLSSCAEQFTSTEGKTPSADPNFYKNNGNKTFTDTEYDAHYLAGNYYQWNAAAAGTGGTNINQDAVSSICPKGWRLPSTATDASTLTQGTYAFLLQQYGLASAYNSGSLTGTSNANQNAYNIVLSPLFFVRGGVLEISWEQPRERWLFNAGRDGFYWSARALSYTTNAYSLDFDGSALYPSGKYNYSTRNSGKSLRCLILAS